MGRERSAFPLDAAPTLTSRAAFRRERFAARGVSWRVLFPLDAVAVEAKPTPAEFVDAENLYVTDACIEYLRPLIGELPKYVKLF